MNKVILNQGEKQFERLLELYLRQRSREPHENSGEHLDDDTLSAFVEGGFNKRQDSAIISHLSKCSACRRSILALIRLSEDFGEDSSVAAASSGKQNRWHEYWSSLKVRVFDATDAAVFAHQEPSDDDQAQQNKDT